MTDMENGEVTENEEDNTDNTQDNPPDIIQNDTQDNPQDNIENPVPDIYNTEINTVYTYTCEHCGNNEWVPFVWEGVLMVECTECLRCYSVSQLELQQIQIQTVTEQRDNIMTLPFEEYTPTEVFLLMIVVMMVISGVIKILKGGFYNV